MKEIYGFVKILLLRARAGRKDNLNPKKRKPSSLCLKNSMRDLYYIMTLTSQVGRVPGEKPSVTVVMDRYVTQRTQPIIGTRTLIRSLPSHV